MKIIKIKDSTPLTFKEWKKSEDYAAEVNEAIDNFLYDDGEEVIKYWNDYCEKEGGDNASKYKYESVDEIKEDIETGSNDIDNIVVGNKKLEEDLRLELESIYEKYHGMIKDDEQLTLNEWKKDDKYKEEKKEGVYNFLNKDGDLLIKSLNEYIEPEKPYESIDEIKEIIKDNPFNLVYMVRRIHNTRLEYHLEMELRKVYRKYHPIIENKKEDINENDDDIDENNNDFDNINVNEEIDFSKWGNPDDEEFILDDSKKMKKDASEIDFDYLLSEERKAVQDYKDAIAKTSDKSALYVLSHILKEESHHIELLENLRKGKVEFEDCKK